MDDDPMFNYVIWRDDEISELAEIAHVAQVERNPYSDFQLYREMQYGDR